MDSAAELFASQIRSQCGLHGVRDDSNGSIFNSTYPSACGSTLCYTIQHVLGYNKRTVAQHRVVYSFWKQHLWPASLHFKGYECQRLAIDGMGISVRLVN